MAKLIEYTMMSANKNAIDNGYLVKGICEFCGRKFGSIEKAKKCKTKHINDAIRKDYLSDQFITVNEIEGDKITNFRIASTGMKNY